MSESSTPSGSTASPDTGANPLSVHINADTRQLWVMLREPAEVSQWHGWDYDGLADEIRTIYFSPTAVEGPDHRTLTLEGGDTFLLEPGPDGTQVTIERGTPEPGSDLADWHEDITEGWISFLQQLRFALERHPNTRRRTAFFSGTPTDGQSIISRVRADSLGAPGEEYSLTAPGGGELTGRVWFRSERQVGLTVARYAEHGHGLLILADQPLGIRDEPSSLMIASTYELGAQNLRGIWDGWESLRREHYPDADPLETSALS